jgi:outer membrane lipoprotein-sorting protein
MLRRFTLGVAVLALAVAPAAAQSVDEVIAKNVEARGGMAKLQAVKSMKITAKASGGGGPELPIIVYQTRPNNARVEFSLQGLTGVQAYDGKTGWFINPFQGKKDAELMGEDQLKQMEEQADFDGPLVNYKDKGHKVELLGKEPVEGTDAYKLRVTLKNGNVQTVYLDGEEYLEIKTEQKRIVRGTETETETIIGDYKDVEGIMVPFSTESGPKGSPSDAKQKFTVEKVEFNVPVEAAIFHMPASGPKSAEAASAKPEEKKETKKPEDKPKM